MQALRDSGLRTRQGWGRGLESRVATLVAATMLIPSLLVAQDADPNGVRSFVAGK